MMPLSRLQKIISRAALISRRKAESMIKQGSNHKIRRISNISGYPVQELQRIDISNIKSNGLKEDECRELSTKEFISLLD